MKLGYGAYGLIAALYLAVAGALYYAGATWLYDAMRPNSLEGASSFPLEGYTVFLMAVLIPVILLAAVVLQWLLSLTGRLGDSFAAKDVEQVFRTTGLSATDTESRMRSVDLKAVHRMTLKRLLLSWLVVTVVFSPVLYQAARSHFSSYFPGFFSYRHVWDFSPGDRVLRTEHIALVRVGVDDTGSHLDPVYEIQDTDGQTFELWEIGLNPTSTERLVSLTTKLAKQGIPFDFVPLPDLSRLRPEIQSQILTTIEEIELAVSDSSP